MEVVNESLSALKYFDDNGEYKERYSFEVFDNGKEKIKNNNINNNTIKYSF
jgi:hypothetical protein